MTIVISADPAQRASKDDFQKRNLTKGTGICPECGKNYPTHFKYRTCYECAGKWFEKKKAEKAAAKVEIPAAILAVERRKAEIRAAQRAKK
jgi:hypothetical protein